MTALSTSSSTRPVMASSPRSRADSRSHSARDTDPGCGVERVQHPLDTRPDHFGIADRVDVIAADVVEPLEKACSCS